MSLVGAAALRLRLWPLRVPTSPARGFQWSGDTHYSVLGLQQDASPREIKAAYLALSKQLHPDLNQNKDDKTMFAIHQKYMRVMQAYAVLGTKKDRALYDLQLEGRRGPAGPRPDPTTSTTKANTSRFMSFEERAAAMGYHQDPNYYKKHGNYHRKVVAACVVWIMFGIMVNYVIIMRVYTRQTSELDGMSFPDPVTARNAALLSAAQSRARAAPGDRREEFSRAWAEQSPRLHSAEVQPGVKEP